MKEGKDPKEDTMAHYICLIYSDESQEATDAQQQEIFQAYMKFTEEFQASGKMVGGEALEPTATATTVRLRDNKVVTTDGPFAETKEQLGGYYIVDAKDLDEAIKWAAKIPGAAYGSIEVRPVMVFEGQ